MAKISLNFSLNQFSDSELKVKSSTIAGNLEANPYFESIADSVVVIKTKIATFDDFLTKMAEGNRQLTALKNLARTDLAYTLCDVGRLVQNISKGDEVILFSSGYNIKRKPTRFTVGILDQPMNVTVKPGKINGTLIVSWDGVDHARCYEIRYTRLPKTDYGVYTILTSPNCKVTIEDLISGQQYAIEVAGVGADPRRAWSFEICSFVL